MLRRTFLSTALALTATPAWAQQSTTPTTPAPPQQPDLEPYEPANALERTFAAAFTNESLRPAFRRAFLDSPVVLALASNAAGAPTLFRPLRGQDRAAFVFTSAALFERRFGASAPHATLTGRQALERITPNFAAINFGFAPMLVLDPAGVHDFLALPASPRPAQ